MAVTPNITPASIDSSRGPKRGVKVTKVRTPLWRRLTALISLSSIVVIAGAIVAAVVGVSILLLLMILERAAN